MLVVAASGVWVQAVVELSVATRDEFHCLILEKSHLDVSSPGPFVSLQQTGPQRMESFSEFYLEQNARNQFESLFS